MVLYDTYESFAASRNLKLPIFSTDNMLTNWCYSAVCRDGAGLYKPRCLTRFLRRLREDTCDVVRDTLTTESFETPDVLRAAAELPSHHPGWRVLPSMIERANPHVVDARIDEALIDLRRLQRRLLDGDLADSRYAPHAVAVWVRCRSLLSAFVDTDNTDDEWYVGSNMLTDVHKCPDASRHLKATLRSDIDWLFAPKARMARRSDDFQRAVTLARRRLQPEAILDRVDMLDLDTDVRVTILLAHSAKEAEDVVEALADDVAALPRYMHVGRFGCRVFLDIRFRPWL